MYLRLVDDSIYRFIFYSEDKLISQWKQENRYVMEGKSNSCSSFQMSVSVPFQYKPIHIAELEELWQIQWKAAPIITVMTATGNTPFSAELSCV